MKNLAKTLSTIVSEKNVSFESLSSINLSNIQRFDDLDKGVFYDFGDTYTTLLGEKSFKKIQEQLNKTIVFKDNTNKFITINIINNSGVSTYIPNNNTELSNYYKKLNWYKTIFE